MASEKAVLAIIRASKPTFKNSHDKIAFAVHSCFLCNGFSLTAVGSSAASLASPLSSAGKDEVSIDGWNEVDNSYAFCYERTENGKKLGIIVKALVLDGSLAFDVAVDVNSKSELYHLELDVKDFINENLASQNYADQYKNLGSLVEKVNSSVLSKLEDVDAGGSSRSSNSKVNVTSSGQNTNQDSVPLCDPYSSYDHRDMSGYAVPPVPTVGGNDLLPGPGAGVFPTRSGLGVGGDMLLGPNDPGWGIGMVPDTYPSTGPQGVPPGARFDPYGPPGIPGFEPNRFRRDPRNRPGPGTHPDLEHFQPF